MQKRFKGLTAAEAEISRKKHGDNSLPELRGKGIIRKFFENLGDPIIKILIAALAVEVIFTFGNCNIVEVFGIIAAILIATVVSTLSEYGSEKAFEKLKAGLSDGVARVIRDQREGEISVRDIVVGDILHIVRGDNIHADGVVISGRLTVDQSALTGEQREVYKTEGEGGSCELSDPVWVFRGTTATDGECFMRVMRVGKDTYYGMVARDVQAETRESPLKLRLTALAGVISRIGYFVAALVGIAYLFGALVVDNGFVLSNVLASVKDTRHLLSILIKALTLMIAIVVVAVPEGLPMMVAVVLSANMKRMIKDNILVKKLVGIETAGSLNILFTDKTGTLTEGKLSLDRIVTGKEIMRNTASLKKDNKILEQIIINSLLNTDAKREGGELLGGNTTDRALYQHFDGMSHPSVRVASYIPFRSEIKYSELRDTDGIRYIKGAPEAILEKCRFAMSEDGGAYASDLAFARAELAAATKRGERVIAVAMGRAGSDNLVFVALIVLRDKLRRGVKDAVKTVLTAGIDIVMVTGDNKETASAIAEECGFFDPRRHIALTSSELAELSDDEVKQRLPEIRVLARALPSDKTRLVRLSGELGLVTGMTGDGINDAPSLRLADVGFAMGSGTEIAKSAGDIIILDDSFNSIFKTILYGRTIFKSIRKFITFQLIMNLAASGITLIGQLVGIEAPITIIQMLWVNIIMDTLGGLAFAGEAPMKGYMKERPKRRDEPIISKSMIKHILSNGIFTLALLTAFLLSPAIGGFYVSEAKRLSAFYALFIFSGIVNSFTARSERFSILYGIGRNKPFLFIMLFISVIQILIVYFGGVWFRSIPLTPRELLPAILLPLSLLFFDLVRRVIARLTP